MTSKAVTNNTGNIIWKIFGIGIFLLFAITGCSDSQPQTILSKVVSIEQGGYFSHNYRLQRDAIVELAVESSNMPIKVFIAPYKDGPAAISGLPISVRFHASNIYADNKRGQFKKGDYTLVVKHGKKKGFFDASGPAARVKIKLSAQ